MHIKEYFNKFGTRIQNQILDRASLTHSEALGPRFPPSMYYSSFTSSSSINRSAVIQLLKEQFIQTWRFSQSTCPHAEVSNNRVHSNINNHNQSDGRAQFNILQYCQKSNILQVFFKSKFWNCLSIWTQYNYTSTCFTNVPRGEGKAERLERR